LAITIQGKSEREGEEGGAAERKARGAEFKKFSNTSTSNNARYVRNPSLDSDKPDISSVSDLVSPL